MTLFDPEVPPLDAEPSQRIRLDLAYDGAEFHGAAANPGVRTVAGTLTDALERILRHQVTLTLAGRTDAGVHARQQVVTFDAVVGRVDCDRLPVTLSKLCGPDLVVLAAAVVPDDFDARFSAVERRYRYSILRRSLPDPLRRHTVWHVPAPLDVARMRLCCDPLIGEHDFSSFCRRPKDRPDASLVRRVRDLRVVELDDDLLEVRIAANAFCHQMVRSIVGVLVSVGDGKLTAADVMAILRARDRTAVPRVAPPQGLVLDEVVYPT